jgi:hypothetical protein
MNISRKAKQKALELKEFSGSKIKNPDDMLTLIEISLTPGKEKMFEDIQFTAKYLNGLGKALKTNISNLANPKQNGKSVSAEDARKKIMDEFKANMKKLSEMFSEYIKEINEAQQTEFKDKYLSLNGQALQNLTTLIYDLSWLKILNNSKKTPPSKS